MRLRPLAAASKGGGGMIGPGQFYCVKCSKLLVVDRAKQLFRTGYYRIQYPLGLCSSCARLNLVKKTETAT